MRARGIELSLTKTGQIAAHPGAGLEADELAAIVRHKPAIVALLTAEAEAARPLVIA